MTIRSIWSSGLAVVFLTVLVCSAAAQQLEPSYDISLQLIVGSTDTAKAELPASLVPISRQLKNSFNFASYRLAGTYLGRISNTGSFEYKSASSLFGADTESRPQPTFMEWSVSNLHSGPTAKGPLGFQGQAFRFGARVPVITAMASKTRSAPVVQYESIGLSLAKFGVPDSSPTLIGTLNLPGANGTVFLVMTVRSSDL